MPLIPEKANPDYKYLNGKYAYARLLWDENLSSTQISDCHREPVIFDPVQAVCPVCKAEIVYYPYNKK